MQSVQIMTIIFSIHHTMVLCYSIPSLLTSDNNDFVLCCDNVTQLPSLAMQEMQETIFNI